MDLFNKKYKREKRNSGEVFFISQNECDFPRTHLGYPSFTGNYCDVCQGDKGSENECAKLSIEIFGEHDKKIPEEITVSCTWGDGPDMVLSGLNWSIINDTPTVDLDKWKHGVQKNWSTDLTRDEAVRLIGELQMAVKQVDELEEICKQHDEWVEENGEEF